MLYIILILIAIGVLLMTDIGQAILSFIFLSGIGIVILIIVVGLLALGYVFIIDKKEDSNIAIQSQKNDQPLFQTTDIDKDHNHRVAQKICQAMAEVKTNKNYTAKGKSNTFGAYEYSLGFWQDNSNKYFGVILDDTPENQDKICMAWIYDRLNKSFNVPQVISMWIAGDTNPNAYLDPEYKGINSLGEYYNVPEQVQAIQNRFDELNGW